MVIWRQEVLDDDQEEESVDKKIREKNGGALIDWALDMYIPYIFLGVVIVAEIIVVKVA